MKVILLLALFAVSAYAQLVPGSLSERETQYAAYSEYIYEYKAQILSGLPDVSREYAGLKVKCNVQLQIHSQNRFLMKLKDIQLCKIQKELDEPQMQQPVQAEDCQEDRQIQEIIQALEKRIEFYWTRGKINQISTRQSDPDWSVNIKRGVLELLQVNLAGNPDSPNKNRPRSTVQNEYYRVMEQGIEGECETIYSVKVDVSERERVNNQIIPERDVLNVKKVKNFEKCNDRPTRTHSAILKGLVCTDCSVDKQHEEKLLTQLGQVRYIITGNRKLFMIDSVFADGKHIFEPLGGVKSAKAVTFVNQTLIRREIKKIPTPQDPNFIPDLDQNDRKDQPQGLKFVFPQEKPREVISKATHKVECQPMSQDHGLHAQIEQLLNNIVNGIDRYVQEESLQQLQLLKQKLEVLNRTELCHCMNHFGQDLVNDNELNAKRRMILEDILPHLGSLHSVEVLYRRIESRRIVGHRASELVAQLAFQPKPDDQIVDTVLELCMSDAVSEQRQLQQTCWLTFGSLVNQACKDEDRQRCPLLKQERYMRALVAGIGRQRPEDERRMCLKAIGNAGIHFQNSTYVLLDEVEKIINDKLEVDTSPEIKAQALYALRRVTIKKPEEIRAMLLPILRNQDINQEVRIAAFIIYMDTQPDHLSIQMLAQLLQRETSRQVGNFMYSYLKGLADSKIPCRKNITEGAREALQIAKKWANGLQYSKSFHWKFELLKKKISSVLNMNWISAPESSYGIGGSSKLSTKILNRNFNWFEWGYHSEHMEELAQRLVFKIKGVYPPINKRFKDQKDKLSGLTSREMLMGEQGSDLDALLKRIDTEVNVTERHPDSEPMSISFYIKMFGQELRYITFNKSQILAILAGDNKIIRDLEVYLSVNKPQVKYQKAFTIGDGWQLWPTSVGIPLNLNLTNSGLLAVDAIGKAVMNPSLQNVLKRDDVRAKNIEVSGSFNPRMGILTQGRLGVSLNHQLKAGVALEALVNTSIVINGSLKLDVETLKMESTFQAPQQDHTVVSIKSKPFTFTLIGEEMPKKYRPASSGKSMLHMMRMTPEQIKEASNQERRRVVRSRQPVVRRPQIGNRTIAGELQWSVTPASDMFYNPLQCLLAGPANANIVLKPGLNRPEQIQVVGVISDWIVTPEQYEDHIRRSNRRQHIEDPSLDSSESGSRSFTSAERLQDVQMPGEFRNSKELSVPSDMPPSLEETRSQDKFDFDTAHWREEDHKTQPMTRIRMQQQQQQQQQPDCGEKFIPLKRIYLNVTAKGNVPQSELLTAITLDATDFHYKALTFDIISETKRTEEEIRLELEHKEEMENLRNDPLNPWNQQRLEILMGIDEIRQKEKQEERSVLCLQGEIEMPELKFQQQSQGDVLPALLVDETQVKYRLGVQYGKTCETDKKIQILARAEKSKQQLIAEARSRLGQKSGDEIKCEEDRRRGEMYSWTCKRVVEDRSTLRSLNVAITSKVGMYVRELKSVVGNLMMKLLVPIGIVQQQDAINEQEKIYVSIDQDRSRQLFNISVKAPLKNIKIQTRKLPIKPPPIYSTVIPMSKFALDQVLTQAKPRCKITSLDKVTTFDNVTFDYELSKCHHILAKDCSPTERFLVTAHKKQQDRPEKDVIIYQARHKIELRQDDVEGVKVVIDDVNQQMQPRDLLTMREDGSMEKKNILACQRRTLIDVIKPAIEDDGITSSEVYRILTHKSRNQTPPPAGQSTPRPYSHSASHGQSASRSAGSISLSMGSTSSEEVHMKNIEKETWNMMKEVMLMTFEGRDQREIMEILRIEDQLRTEDGYLIDQVQAPPSSRPLLQIFKTTNSVMLYDLRLGLFVSTCGRNIKVEVARHFQDMVCGMCGNFNGELTDELQGPSKEIYQEPKQFALAYQLQSIPQECAQECVPRSNIEVQDLTIDNVDSSCYSKVLIPRCRNTCRVAETKRVKTKFVCIPRDSTLKVQLDDSVQRQRPHEVVNTLKNKNPSFVEEIEIHTRCQQ